MTDRVGIVLVSFNAAAAVRATLASLRATRNDTPYELLLVDNASRDEDRAAIRAAVEHHRHEAGVPWTFLAMERNLGFAGGNNVGIRHFLAQPAYTHVCLLNSDVVVTDGWLDALVAARRDVVSCVTNKADSEQSIPVDYELTVERCLEPGTERLAAGVREQVERIAALRRACAPGNVVDTDVTFFCVLLSRRVLAAVGELDEAFFPGGFEDDDYCWRARAAGYGVHLDRGVYVHHSGSASFGQLDYGYFNEQAARNRSHLERKHGRAWLPRPEKPFESFAQDVAHALTAGTAIDAAAWSEAVAMFRPTLDDLLSLYEREFHAQRGALGGRAAPWPAGLEQALPAAERAVDGVLGRWREAFAACARRDDPAALERLRACVNDIGVFARSTLVIHAFLQTRPRARPWPQRLGSLVRHGLPFLLRLRGVLFLGGYPYPARDGDGYFQRVRAIDSLFADRWRVYVDPSPLPEQTAWYDLPAPRTLVLRPTGSRRRRALVGAVALLVALRCRVVYFHSVLRIEDCGAAHLLRLPFVRKVLDVHGVVPEEFRMHGDWYSASRFDRHEHAAVRRARTLVVVTVAMRRYFEQKYRAQARSFVVLPVFPPLPGRVVDPPLADGRPVVVYAGGLHRWQQVPKMIDAIVRTHATCSHRFYTAEPERVRELLPARLRDDPHVVVGTRRHADLLQEYARCHFGFVLREDSVVNQVACPTKLVEYLATGVVPIVDSEVIGDFVALGAEFVRLSDFLAGALPSPERRLAMAQRNLVVFERLRALRVDGGEQLRAAVDGRSRADGPLQRALWRAAKLFPLGTLRGRLARRIWWALTGGPPVPPSPAASPLPAAAPGADAAPDPTPPPAELAPCDVLVQADNFTEGGLENVVLDLDVAFRAAGLHTGMLVLGATGSAVARARAQGVPVVAARYSDTAYRQWLATSSPRVVISHYSTSGAALCSAAGVPLVQVLHNTYMWLDDAQRQQLAASVPHTRLFVAVSEFVRDYSVRRLGLPAAKCRIIPNGIEVERFRRAVAPAERQRLRASLRIDADAFVFLAMGSLNHQKNPASLITSFAAIAPQCPDARLLLVGPAPEPELLHRCRTLVDQHGLQERVSLTGAVPDAHRYYGLADAFVHSAFFEGGQLSLLEALAANLPVVTTEVGFAMHFRGRPGVRLVAPHVDIAAYDGHITRLRPSPETERELAAAMLATWRERVRPDLPDALVTSFDRAHTYRAYVELVHALARGDGAVDADGAVGPRSWTDTLAEAM